jgi:hypothetical protein
VFTRHGAKRETNGEAAVGVDLLHEGQAGARMLQQPLRAVAVLNVGWVNLDGRKAAIGLGQNVPLASVDPLSGVVACASPS